MRNSLFKSLQATLSQFHQTMQRGCATRSAGHTVQMNDPEAESKNAPQEEKIPAWLKWFRILVITSFLFVVGVVLWVFWIIKVNLDKWPTVQ